MKKLLTTLRTVRNVAHLYLISNMSRSLRHARVKRVRRRSGPLHAGAILPSSPSTFNGSVGAVVVQQQQ
jgi:hypothetical protein